VSKLSQTQKIVEFLKQYPNERFNARQIAEQITSKYPEDYQEKKANPRFLDDKAFISQVVAEIGSQKDQIISIDKNIGWQDKPRPRVYWYSPQSLDVKGDIALIDKEDDIQDENHAENLAEKVKANSPQLHVLWQAHKSPHQLPQPPPQPPNATHHQ
jgi:hypothetical protein